MLNELATFSTKATSPTGLHTGSWAPPSPDMPTYPEEVAEQMEVSRLETLDALFGNSANSSI
jgi:hypothetical protein